MEPATAKLPQTIERQPSKVAGILMKRMTKRHNQVRKTSNLETTLDFGHHRISILHVLEHCVALDPPEKVATKRKLLGRANDIDSVEGEKVDIDKIGDTGTGTTDVKVPTAQAVIALDDSLRRIVVHRRRRFDQLSPTASAATPQL